MNPQIQRPRRNGNSWDWILAGCLLMVLLALPETAELATHPRLWIALTAALLPCLPWRAPVNLSSGSGATTPSIPRH
jgi:hypothetical protein